MTSLHLPAIDAALSHTLAAGLGVIFILGALPKLRDLPLFQAIVDNYRLLPAAATPAVALLVALSELLAGIGLVIEPWRASAALLAIALLVTVSSAVAINLGRQRRTIDCGCGGLGEQQQLSWGLVLRNALLAALTTLTASPIAARELVSVDYFSVGVGTLALLALYSAGNQLLANHTHLQLLRNPT